MRRSTDRDARDGAAAQVLGKHGVTLDLMRRQVVEAGGVGDGDPSKGMSFSPRATVVGKLAEVEAERLGEVRPRGEHVLLAILTEGEGVPNHLLRKLDVDVAKLRLDLLEALEVPSDLREVYLRQRIAVEQARRSP